MENQTPNIPDKAPSPFSDIIDIRKLENENRNLLFAGFLVAILAMIALDSFLAENKRGELVQPVRKEFRLPVSIVTISKEKVKSEIPLPPVIVQKQDNQSQTPETISLGEKREIIEQPVSTAPDSSADMHLDKEKTASILFQHPPVRELPSLAETARDSGYTDLDGAKINYLHIPYPAPDSGFVSNNFWKYHATIPLSENTAAIVGPGYGIIYYDPFPDKEEEEDERRQFKYDILGIPIGGKGLAFGVTPGAVFLDVGGILNSGRHFLKSVAWKIEDMAREGRIQAHRTSGFSRVTEKDIRFMILLWRFDRVDPRKISLKDRKFIASAESQEIMTNNHYLDTMEKRGLASSLKKSGRMVYKANFSRDEILHTFIAAYGAVKEPETKNTVLSYITLINNN